VGALSPAASTWWHDPDNCRHVGRVATVALMNTRATKAGLAVVAALLATTTILVGCGSGSSSGGASVPKTTSTATGRGSGGDATSRAPSTSSHIVVIVMENKENTDVLGSSAAPYLNGLAQRYGVATQSYAITHPSLPNYLALTSGSTQGITSDCTDCSVAAPNIVDQLTNAGISWKDYVQDYPAPCFTGATAGNYAKRHNPFIYYNDIAQNPALCSHLVGFDALTADLRSGQLPTYAWITPNVCNDTHDCGVATGDSYLAATVPLLLRELGPHGVLVLTWDEGSSNAGCCGGVAGGGHVATVVAGPHVVPGSQDSAPVDHYGVLATIERSLGLPLLAGAADSRNGQLDPLFARPPRIG
jgi:phosphatidylinositol-3-phosphatase